MANTRQSSNQASITRDRYANFLCTEDGLSIVEYAIAAGLIAAAIAVTFGIMGATINAIIVTIIAAL